MRLQITTLIAREVAEIVRIALPNQQGTVGCATVLGTSKVILGVFQDKGLTTFTKRDLNYVLKMLCEEPCPNKVFTTLVTPYSSVGRGLYSFAFPAMAAPVPVEKPVVAPKATPVVAPKATPVVAPKATFVVAPKATPVVVGGRGVAWVLPQPGSTNPGYYAEDMGLRRMAITQTSCFGAWSPVASACKTCPLAGFCASASSAVLADIARDLDLQTEQALTSPMTVKILKARKKTPVVEAPKEDPTYPEGAVEMRVSLEGICAKCSDILPEDSVGVHIPGTGLLHPSCARTN